MAKTHPADIAAKEQLEKEREICRKGEALALVLPFLAFLFVLLALFFIIPDRAYSKEENKSLSSFPSFAQTFGDFSVAGLGESLLNKDKDDPFKEFNKKISTYITDQFPFKEQFVSLNAAYDLASGRLGSGGVLYGKDGYLLQEEGWFNETGEEQKQFDRIVGLVDSLAKELPVTVAVAPTGSQALPEKLPSVISSAPAEERYAKIEEAFGGKDYTFVDLKEVLAAHRDEPIYYRTDHHWTTLGACYGASAILEALGKAGASPDEYRKDVVIDDFKGTVYNRSGMFWHGGEEIEYFRYGGDDGYTVSLCSAKGVPYKTTNKLYDLECLRPDYTGTAYDSFVAPVSVPVVRIEKEGEERQTMLVLKDSFAHCALPFLAREYNIVTVDIRQNLSYALELIDQGKVDLMLVLINAETLLGS